MHRIQPRFLPMVVALLGSACATAQQDSDGEFASRDVLTIDQIAAVRATNAYDAVERLKSHWLRPQGRTQMPAGPGSPQFRENPVQVYLDDQRLGGVATLRNIETAVIRYIQYFSATEASARWGLNNAGGAILVSTRSMD